VQTAVETAGYSDRADVTSLILDEKCISQDIEGLDGFVNLKTLSLIKCGIVNVADLPNLPELRKLNLSQNRISTGLSIVCDNPKLTKVEEFKALTDLKHLQRIDAEGCNFEDEEHVSTIFAMFPEGQMQNVDGYNEKGEEVYSDSEDDSEDEEDEEEDRDDEEDDLDDLDDDLDEDDEEEDDGEDDDDEKPAYAALIGDAILSDDDEDARLSEEEDEGSEDFDDEEDDFDDEDEDDLPAAKKLKQ
jgi:hypothetical protein